MSAVTWKDADANAPYASVRVRVSLKPGQLVHLDGSQRQSMGLLCGADASSLAVPLPQSCHPSELIRTVKTGGAHRSHPHSLWGLF